MQLECFRKEWPILPRTKEDAACDYLILDLAGSTHPKLDIADQHTIGLQIFELNL